MCGVYGNYRLAGAPAGPAPMPATGRVIVHLGPDDEGRHTRGPCAMGAWTNIRIGATTGGGWFLDTVLAERYGALQYYCLRRHDLESALVNLSYSIERNPRQKDICASWVDGALSRSTIGIVIRNAGE